MTPRITTRSSIFGSVIDSSSHNVLPLIGYLVCSFTISTQLLQITWVRQLGDALDSVRVLEAHIVCLLHHTPGHVDCFLCSLSAEYSFQQDFLSITCWYILRRVIGGNRRLNLRGPTVVPSEPKTRHISMGNIQYPRSPAYPRIDGRPDV